MTRVELRRHRSRPSRPNARRSALVPDGFHIARRTMNAVKFDIGFTAVYNQIELPLASLCFLPPAIAAAVQSVSDFDIAADPARRLRPSKAAIRAGRSE